MRRLLVSHVSRHPEEGDQDSKNNPNVDAHGLKLCRVGAIPNRSPYNKYIRRHSTEEAPAFLAAEFRDYFFAQYPATATRRNSDTISDSIINMASELCYEMAHEQRLIFERRYCRGYL